MAAATAVIFDPSHLEVLEARVRELEAKQRRLLETNANLRIKNQALAERSRELEHELMIARLDSGALSPPAAIGDRSAAEVWLTWAHRNHHTDACSCHRCTEARRAL